MQELRQATQITIQFGPFVDKTNGVDLKTDATTITDIDHAETGLFVSKLGATAAVRHQGIAAASVADAYGMMKVTLDATDTGTIGQLDVTFAKAATYLPVSKSFMVLDEAVYDAKYGTTAPSTLTQTQVTGGAYDVTNAAVKNAFATAIWQDATAGDFTAASSIGKSLYTSGVVPGGTNGLFIAGTNAQTTITTSLITGAITLTTPIVSDMTKILGSGLTEGAVGRLAAALTKLLDVAAPVATAANVNQTGDSFSLFTGITSLAAWLRGLFRKDAINAAALAEINAIHDGGAAGTFSATTDSAEAIADADTAAALTQQNVRDAMKLAPSSGTPAAGSLDKQIDDIQTKTDTIGSVAFTVTSPVASDGTITIYRGCDWPSDGAALSITGYTGLSMTGGTAVLRLVDQASYDDPGDSEADLEVAATAVSQSGTALTITVALTAAQTAALGLAYPPADRLNYVYEIIGTTSAGKKIPIALGAASVVQEIR